MLIHFLSNFLEETYGVVHFAECLVESMSDHTEGGEKHFEI